MNCVQENVISSLGLGRTTCLTWMTSFINRVISHHLVIEGQSYFRATSLEGVLMRTEKPNQADRH